MSMPRRSSSPQVPATEWRPHSDRLSVITAGQVGNIESRLGVSGFDVIAVAQTEDALIDAVSADEPDAIVVEADLCASLEHVRDLAPDAVLIVVGDHTPAGALGRIEQGASGTVVAGLLHALVADGVGAAVVWGLMPAFRPRAVLQVPQRMSASLLSAKADVVRAYVATAFRDHAESVIAAGTVLVTATASVLLMLSAPSRNEPRVRAPVPAQAIERAPQHPAVAMYLTTRTQPAYVPFMADVQPGRRRELNRGDSRDHGRHDHPSSDASRPPGVANGWDKRPPGVANGWDRRPPKHADNGYRRGWDHNSVPEDLPPGRVHGGVQRGRTIGASVGRGNAPPGHRGGRGT
jgi:hypothetical protein